MMFGYLFEHKESLFAAVEVLRRLVGDQVSRISAVQALDYRPDISDCIIQGFTFLEFIFGDCLRILNSLLKIQFDNF